MAGTPRDHPVLTLSSPPSRSSGLRGPVQGKAAGIRIPLDKGVCGAAARLRTSQRVEDVDAFPGHIACDAASRSELVVPIVASDRLVGVLDLDSPPPGRFTPDDQARRSEERRVGKECVSTGSSRRSRYNKKKKKNIQ